MNSAGKDGTRLNLMDATFNSRSFLLEIDRQDKGYKTRKSRLKNETFFPLYRTVASYTATYLPPNLVAMGCAIANHSVTYLSFHFLALCYTIASHTPTYHSIFCYHVVQ